MTLSNKTSLNGTDLLEMFSMSTEFFESHVESINALNVFPVPDGDTGVNMYRTLSDMMDHARRYPSESAGEVINTMAQGSLRGARGNSGVILSQIIKGIAEETGTKKVLDVSDFAKALMHAKKEAYKAVGEPVEGTMLTVLARVADAACKNIDNRLTLSQMFDLLCVSAKETVKQTPSMMKLLRDSGVVDAGGQGLYVILEGCRQFINGTSPKELFLTPHNPVHPSTPVHQPVTNHIPEYGYCTQFLITAEALDLDFLRTAFKRIASSVVVAGTAQEAKVHVHTDDPGAILTYAITISSIHDIDIQNMDDQHDNFSSNLKGPDRTGTGDSVKLSVDIVAIVQGIGFQNIFTQLGTNKILIGGNTMNPSVKEILEVIDQSPSDHILLLPNNRNILSAARQAGNQSPKHVYVIPSTTIPHGICALLAYNSENALEENILNMTNSYSDILTGEITRATRSLNIRELSVKEDDYIGLIEHELAVSGEDLSKVLVDTLRKADVSENHFVSIYYGDQVTDDDVKLISESILSTFPNIDIDITLGGQPNYHIILSLE